MARNRRARLGTNSINHIDDALGYSGAIQKLDETNGRERSLFRWLDYDAVPGRERWGQAFRKDHQRMIE